MTVKTYSFPTIPDPIPNDRVERFVSKGAAKLPRHYIKKLEDSGFSRHLIKELRKEWRKQPRQRLIDELTNEDSKEPDQYSDDEDSKKSSIADFVDQYSEMLCYPNANSRTLGIVEAIAKKFSLDQPLSRLSGLKRGRGRPGYYFEFEVLYLYCNGFSTREIAEFIVEVFKERGNVESICERCIQKAKKRSPALAFASAVVSQEQRDRSTPGQSEKDAVEALGKLGIGQDD